ncbi:MAG: DUF4352 domain-containing protein [Clostridiales bacterium]|nr:DUF4352 domain-containing protein [Clostridiales bacterium]
MQRWLLILIAVILVLCAAVPMVFLGVLWTNGGIYENRLSVQAGREWFGRESAAAFGEPGVYSNCEIIVTDVTRSQGLSHDHPPEGMEYVIVAVNIRNIGTERKISRRNCGRRIGQGCFPLIKITFNCMSRQVKGSPPRFSFAHMETALSKGYLDPWEQVSRTILFEAPIGCKATLYYYCYGMDFLEDDRLSLRFELE